MPRLLYGCLLLVVLFGLGVMGCSKVFKQGPYPINYKADLAYSFFVAGHVYNWDTEEAGLHPPFRNHIPLLSLTKELQFGFFTGDFVRAPSNESYDLIISQIQPIGKPVHMVMGNHEALDRALFEERIGPAYYSLDYFGDLFIVLDPNEAGWSIEGEQLAWLQQELDTKAGTADNVFIFFHQVLWWSPDNLFQEVVINSNMGRGDSVNFWTELMPMFEEVPKPVYLFCGDLGLWDRTPVMYFEHDHITFIGSGMGDGTHDNFVIADVMQDGSVRFRLISVNGKKPYAMGELEDYRIP